MPHQVDVAIVGAGPAGLAAATELRRLGIDRVVVLERESEPGGVPRHCGHSPYGLREFKRPMLGPAYARSLVSQARRAGVRIATGVTVIALKKGPCLEISSDAGLSEISAKVVMLATGIRETTRAGQLLGGTKPGGVLTTGALQGLVYGAGMRPFRRPVILGTELVAFSAILTCRHAGIRPVAMIEPGHRTTARWPASLLPRLLGIPLLYRTGLVSIEGRETVEEVVLRTPGGERRLAADGVIVTGRFRPEASLVRLGGLTYDPATGGPEVDEFGRTSDPQVFAAGNLLRGVETAGWCWAEGRAVAGAMARALSGGLPPPASQRIGQTGEHLAYVLPQRIAGGAAPALDVLQLRACSAARGRLSLHAGGQETAGRALLALPERRLLLPLPSPGSDPSVSLEPSS
ncbi:NAD(P)/FAD-dependent oxidoreductase [Ponticoccus sp. SC2-23]|nr:NAD(P)/FAD-dependent oxidoreductase [Ponticoccus sp. SC6-9]MBM1226469.1 NAD(P)/FAD-dependent oxidoreductase [Ponticoccus sp. SC6-15]MBM1230420.1 NAD(P)/FAD-dependent oxidoreductase [Ponticoccus sp. SC6-38]MBM1234943.1 NAD(P)/FAD-dependent oxidoreductase [Ponticoccus sp. SC6-45]MBM1239441.1 NAD(P)/FAD-dependent oxidoreductase [Ponticoccus sp. SC6-49]MBM1243223.1 NAD(P)/FAD-dependent oxidoreductase [Ponticoccus sp. SC2-64]MBM1248467.1 NAD(P)/FAD-dependent oxidoreductase [Ponticoccus sp. SC6-